MLLSDSIPFDGNISRAAFEKHFVSLRLSKTCFLAIELTRSLFWRGKGSSPIPCMDIFALIEALVYDYSNADIKIPASINSVFNMSMFENRCKSTTKL